MANSGMMSIDLVSPTIEAVYLNAISGVIAQAFNAYQARDLYSIDLAQIVQFMLFTCITAAPNFLFQTAMEKAFPTKTIPRSERQKINAKDHSGHEALLEKYGRLDIRNTVIKFFLDQSLSASVNTMLFICVLGLIKGRSFDYIQHDLYENFWALLFAGYRFWPMVCLLNLVVVPWEYRALVGNGAGLVWGVYMSFR